MLENCPSIWGAQHAGETREAAPVVVQAKEHTREVAPTAPDTGLILRFRPAEIATHWSIAVPYMICFSTGLLLKVFFSLHSESLVRLALSLLHKTSGISLIVLPLASAVRHRRDISIHIYNIKKVLSWNLADVRWIFLMGAAALCDRIKLPEQHKFNAAEKLNFMMVLGSYPFFAATGVVLLTPGVHFLTFLGHIGLAILVTPLLLGHVYMALVNPGTRVGLSGMLSGHVDREWARHHYTHWYRELFGHEEMGVPAEASEPTSVPVLALIRCAPCASEHVVDAHAVALEGTVAVRFSACPHCRASAELVSVVAEPGRVDTIFSVLEDSGVRVVAAGLPVEASSTTPEPGEPAKEQPRQACNS